MWPLGKIDRLQKTILQRPASLRRCSDRNCKSGQAMWSGLSQARRAVDLQGLRWCFPRCFNRELERLILEASSGQWTPAARPRRMPLGLLLLSRGQLTSEQLQQALDAQRLAGRVPIGKLLRDLNFVSENQVTAALAAQWGCPVIRALPPLTIPCPLPAEFL